MPLGQTDTTSTAKRHLLIIAIVALALRLAIFAIVYIVQKQPIDLVGGGDASAYMAMASYVYHSGEISDSLFLPRAFLFPALAGTLYHLTGEAVFLIVFLNIGLGVATCLLVYSLARTIGQLPRTALAAGLLTAFYPAMLYSSIGFMTDPLFLFFLALGLLLFARFLCAPNWRDLLFSGAVLALTTLTRAVTILLPLLLIGLIRGKQGKQYAAIFLIMAVLPGAILTFRNWYYGGIATFSTEGQWALLFMRATSSERRATGEPTGIIYARYIQEIERRLGNPVPPLESIQPSAIWNYFQPTPAVHSIVSQMALEKNLAYPQWYVLNTVYGLHRILSESPLPPLIGVPLHYAFVGLACLGGWRYWRHERRHTLFLGLPVLMLIGLNVALQTAVLETRHGLPAALLMFILAAQGFEAVSRRFNLPGITLKG